MKRVSNCVDCQRELRVKRAITAAMNKIYPYPIMERRKLRAILEELARAASESQREET